MYNLMRRIFIALASFLVLAVAIGAPQNVRAAGLVLTIGSPGGRNVNIAYCSPWQVLVREGFAYGLVQVNFSSEHTGTWAWFRGGVYSDNSGQRVEDKWIEHTPATRTDYEISYFYIPLRSGYWAPFVEYYIWDPSSSQWWQGFYWVTFLDGTSWCEM